MLCRATDHIRGADRLHRRHREERLRVPDVRRHLFRHVEAAGLRLSRAARRQGAGSRQARRPGREAAPVRLRAVEVLGARREAADGVGQPVGQGLPGLAHRVLGDGAEVPRRLLRHPLRRRGPHSGPPHERDRADRGPRRHAPREFLAARLLPAVERREDGEVGRRIPADRVSRRARLRSARLPLPVPHRALPRPAQFHLGRARRGRRRARPDAQRRVRGARRRHGDARTPALLERFSERDQRRSQPAARAGGGVGDAARRSRAGRASARRCSRSTPCSACGSRNGRRRRRRRPTR